MSIRILTIVLNFAFLILLTISLSESGIPSKGKDVLIVFLAFTAPIFSLIFIFLAKNDAAGTGLFSLFFERKRLEEQQRINELKSKNSTGN